MKTSMLSSKGFRLTFLDKELLSEYEQEEERLYVATYKKIRIKYGIWASNQDKFVDSQEDFNGSDSTFMEDLFDKHSKE